jgi:hypothetical protein
MSLYKEADQTFIKAIVLIHVHQEIWFEQEISSHTPSSHPRIFSKVASGHISRMLMQD